MKLIVCTDCWDVFKLETELRHCKCGKCQGRYLDDGLNAEYGGECAIPIGFHNTSLLGAIRSQPETGAGREFIAFVIPKSCNTMENKTP